MFPTLSFAMKNTVKFPSGNKIHESQVNPKEAFISDWLRIKIVVDSKLTSESFKAYSGRLEPKTKAGFPHPTSMVGGRESFSKERLVFLAFPTARHRRVQLKRM